MGNELLDTVDHYALSYFLLFGCFLESIMFAADYGWTRFEAAIRQATLANRSTPGGRYLFPHPQYWRFCLYVTVPGFTMFLFIQLWREDTSRRYSAYPGGLQAVGWTLISLLLAIAPLTFWQTSKGSLEPMSAASRQQGGVKRGFDSPELVLTGPGGVCGPV
uniref:Uncharacterized protein n=1 Tax=Haptolina ericina TaxID=156174 RepID=A0A7S3EXJ0_9EUKA